MKSDYFVSSISFQINQIPGFSPSPLLNHAPDQSHQTIDSTPLTGKPPGRALVKPLPSSQSRFTNSGFHYTLRIPLHDVNIPRPQPTCLSPAPTPAAHKLRIFPTHSPGPQPASPASISRAIRARIHAASSASRCVPNASSGAPTQEYSTAATRLGRRSPTVP